MARALGRFRPVMAVMLLAAIWVGMSRPASALTVKAKSAVLIDFESGQVLYEQDSHRRLPPASVTKVMTMLLIVEAVEAGRVRWDDEVVTSAEAAGMGGSQIYLREGETMTLAEMTKAIAVVSANDSSAAVAEHIYGTIEDFVAAMNRRGKELGLKDTHFQNEHGLPDPGHYSSAYDLAVISRELLRHPKILEWTSTWITYLRDGKFFMRNTNELIQRYRGADGLKTGHTDEAGYSLSATARREGFRLVSVILGTSSNEVRIQETTRLLNYGFRNFARVAVIRKGESLGTVRIDQASPSNVSVVAPREFGVLVERGRERYIEKKVVPLPKLRPPIRKGEPVAELVVTSGRKEVGRTRLVALQDVRRANFIVRFFRWIAGLIRGLFRR